MLHQIDPVDATFVSSTPCSSVIGVKERKGYMNGFDHSLRFCLVYILFISHQIDPADATSVPITPCSIAIAIEGRKADLN